MPRPRKDVTAERERLLDAAEAILRRRGAEGVTLSAVARHCGMSQSNAYRFFEDRREFMGCIAERWFRDIEESLARIAESDDRPKETLRRFLLTQLRLKRDRYDADPELFEAYVALGMRNYDAIHGHVERMRALLEGIVARYLGATASGGDPTAVERTTTAIQDLTVQFRDPRLIAGRREACSDARALSAIEMILAGLPAPE